MYRKILITGFEPFGGESINPAWEAVKSLPEKTDGNTIYKLEVPTSFKRAAVVVKNGISTYHPDAVLCIGQAGKRASIAVEKVAINYCDASIPDNDGFCPKDQTIFSDGPAAYFATLPVQLIVAELYKQGIPATVSYSAGTYVCNFLFYSLMHMIASEFPSVRGGFIHVPYIPEQVVDKPDTTPSMSLSLIIKALECAVKVVEETSF